MRRLYSTFAGGWPGTGLLLLRLVAGSLLVARAGSSLADAPGVQMTVSAALLIASGLLLIAGLWTPIAGTIAAVVTIVYVLPTARDPLVSLLIGTMVGALAMLGPGLWSIDARLFGWRRVEPPPYARRPGAA